MQSQSDYKVYTRSPQEIVVLETLSYYYDLRFYYYRYKYNPRAFVKDRYKFFAKAQALIKSIKPDILLKAKAKKEGDVLKKLLDEVEEAIELEDMDLAFDKISWLMRLLGVTKITTMEEAELKKVKEIY